MAMPGRTLHNEKYRYSVNSQEKEPELNANITFAEFWMYDSRIGRRWGIDPIKKDHESSFACFSNNPIFFADPDGLTSEPPKNVNVILVFDPDEAAHLRDAKGSTWKIIQMTSLQQGLKELQKYLKDNNANLANLAIVHHGNEYGHGEHLESTAPITLSKDDLEKLNNVAKELIKNNSGAKPSNFPEDFKKGVLKKWQFSNADIDTYLALGDILSLCMKGGNFISIACDEGDEDGIGAELSYLGGDKINVYSNSNFSVINRQIKEENKDYKPKELY